MSGLIRTGKQHTIRLTRSTTDTASELVHLGQSKTIRPFNDHQRRIGTLTPTSITVVAMRTLVFPLTKSAMTASFSSALRRP